MSRKTIWLHGVSIGETQASLTLYKSLTALYPEADFLLTSTTKTSQTILNKASKELGFSYTKYPLDLPWKVRAFLKKHTPDCAIFIESEIWPFMILALHKQHIPLIIANGKLSNKSYKNWRFFSWLARIIFKKFTLVLAQSALMAERFKSLGALPVYEIGNIKYAADPLNISQECYHSLQAMIHDRPFVVFASTHSPEENLIADLHLKLEQDFPKLLSIIIPRHPERADEILKHLPQKIKTAQRSKNETITDKTQLYLADSLGEMGCFFALAPIVFMGKSLPESAGGGHNPLEPAHHDCVILYGPQMHNFSEIDEEMRTAKASLKISNTAELYEALKMLLQNKDNQTYLAQKAKAFAQKKQAILPDIIDKITPVLNEVCHDPS